MELNNNEMSKIDGGALTSQILNAISKAIGAIYDLGKATGSAIRRIIKNKYCAL